MKNAFYGFLFYDSLMLLRWGHQPDLNHLLSLILLCLIMSQTLIARDLHWRWLLAPGAWRSGRIASEIGATTVKVYYSALVAAVLADVLWTRLVNGADALEVIETAASHVLVLAEVSFAVSVGLVLRVLPRRVVVDSAIFIAIVAAWIYSRVIGKETLWKAPSAGVLYALALVVSAYLILRLADRLWTKEKLMACARGAA